MRQSRTARQHAAIVRQRGFGARISRKRDAVTFVNRSRDLRRGGARQQEHRERGNQTL